jgi:hypothetical protein
LKFLEMYPVLGIAHVDVREGSLGVEAIHRCLALFSPDDRKPLFRGQSFGIYIDPWGPAVVIKDG